MTSRRMLRPLHLFTDGEVTWAVDELQPVAARLDAATGTLRDLVSWPQLPPPPHSEAWRVLSFGPELWVQPGVGGPVGRIGPGGLVAAGYSAGRGMVAVSASGAWCVTEQYVQRLVTSADYQPGPLPYDQVVVVDPAGEVRRIGVDRPVRDVHVTEDGVFLEVEDGPHTMAHLGADTWEVRWRRAWLRVPEGPLPSYVEIAGSEQRTLPSRRIAPGELRRADSASVPDIDISGHCWPLGAPPIEADSYARSQRDRFEKPNWTSSLTGSWPDTQLVLGFEHEDYPGVRLQRAVRLFDELGRIDPPEFADIHLMEDIDTGDLPPASAAIDGVLTV